MFTNVYPKTTNGGINAQGKLTSAEWNGFIEELVGEFEYTPIATVGIIIEPIQCDGAPDLSAYALKSWVEAKGYLTAQNLTGYATEEYVNNAISAATGADLTAYLTKTEAAATYLTSQSLKTINGNSLVGTGDITISGGGGSGTVDSALNNSSTNPVQNKVIYSALEGKASLNGATFTGSVGIDQSLSLNKGGESIFLYVDYDSDAEVVTLKLADSISGYNLSLPFNLERSGVIALMSQLPTIDSALSNSSTNPLQNKAIYSALQGKVTRTDVGQIHAGNIEMLTDGYGKYYGVPEDHVRDEADYILATEDYVAANFVQKVLATKSYTDIIGTANNFDGAAFFFAKVVPTGWDNFWRIKYRIRAHVQGRSANDGEEWSIVEMCGSAANHYWSKIFNATKNTSVRPYYYHYLYRLTEAGFNANYGHLIGVSLQSSYTPTGASYKRDFTIELLEADNCTFTFMDNMTLYSNVTGSGTTNYTGSNAFDAYTQGATITGDRNTTTNFSLSGGCWITAGANGIFAYTIIMADSSGTYQSVVLSRSTGTTKTKNSVGFDLTKPIYWYASSTDIASGNYTTAGLNIGYPGDIRYSCNCGSTLIQGKPFYFVMTQGDDGLFYLDTVWWTQNLPTTNDGKYYVYIGIAYSSYTVDMEVEKYIYYHDGTKLRRYIPGVVSGSGGGGGGVESINNETGAVTVNITDITNAEWEYILVGACEIEYIWVDDWPEEKIQDIIETAESQGIQSDCEADYFSYLCSNVDDSDYFGNVYQYTGETFEYNGMSYWLFERVNYNGFESVRYGLVAPISYTELYKHTIEHDLDGLQGQAWDDWRYEYDRQFYCPFAFFLDSDMEVNYAVTSNRAKDWDLISINGQ